MDTDTGRRYLSYIAGRYPVMCGSDEFYFMPRINSPVSDIESLDADKITEDISRIKKFLEETTEKNAGNRAVCTLLRQSMLTYLMYFEKLRIWEKAPSLYLKICALA